MLETIITSKTRIKILLKFFLNPQTKSHIRALANELGESTNSVRLELNRLLEVSMLKSYKEGNKIIFQANDEHALYLPVKELIKKHIGIDEIIQNILKGLGAVSKVYLGGSFAHGLESDVIDIVMVGNINMAYFIETLSKLEDKISKKIAYIVYTEEEATQKDFEKDDYLLIYSV